jgi:uncharacterized integral membrane protein
MYPLALTILILLLILTLGLYNLDQSVQLRYLFGLTSPHLPLPLVMIGAFLAGMLTAGLLLVPAWIRMRWSLRKQQRQLSELQGQQSAELESHPTNE